MTIFLIIVFVAGFFWFINKTEIQQDLEQDKQGQASPATIKCLDDGLRIELKVDKETKLQTNLCIDEFGNKCDEWDYFNSKCELTKKQ